MVLRIQIFYVIKSKHLFFQAWKLEHISTMFNSPRFSNRFLLPLMLLKLINLATINWYFQISILMNFLCPSSLSFMLSCDNYHIWITLTTTTLSFTAMKIIRGWSPYTCFVLISVFHFFILYFYYLFSNYYYFSFFLFFFLPWLTEIRLT